MYSLLSLNLPDGTCMFHQNCNKCISPLKLPHVIEYRLPVHWLRFIKPLFQESDDEENFIDVRDDEDIETFTDADAGADKENGTVKKIETEETVSENDMETKKAESASWVHFDNLKGEFFKSSNYLLEFLKEGLGSPQYYFPKNGRSHN